MTHYAARTDANHADLRQDAYTAGYMWIDTFRAGQGAPDAWVCSKSGRWIALEIKSPGGRMTPKERGNYDACRRYGAPYEVVHNWAELAAVLAAYDGEPLRNSRRCSGEGETRD